MPGPLSEITEYYCTPDTSEDCHDSVFTRNVRKQVRRDIANMVVPSWIEKPPHNFGSASHGKLKADQWRTLGTIFMVVTLVCLWGRPDASGREREVLQNFVQLAIAVDAATRRSMSPS